MPTRGAFVTGLSAMIPAVLLGITCSAVFLYFSLFSALFCAVSPFWKTGLNVSFNMLRLVASLYMASFLHGADAKIEMSKETNRYKHYIVILSRLHCMAWNYQIVN